MTNPLPPTTPPSPTGGMPKWVIILLVVLLVIMLGCCGGFITCTYVVKRGAAAARVRTQRLVDEIEAEQARRTAEMAAAGTGTNAPDAPTEANGNAAPASPASPASPDAPASARMPANFPTDIPVFSGLAPIYSMADKTKGAGSVVMSGKVDKDKAVTYYEKELEKQGWKQEQNADLGGTTIMAYTKDARKLSMSFNPDTASGVTTVTLTYEQKSE